MLNTEVTASARNQIPIEHSETIKITLSNQFHKLEKRLKGEGVGVGGEKLNKLRKVIEETTQNILVINQLNAQILVL